MRSEGLPYLEKSFPRLDYVTECHVAWQETKSHGVYSDNSGDGDDDVSKSSSSGPRKGHE
jgi:hypothetical protein